MIQETGTKAKTVLLEMGECDHINDDLIKTWKGHFTSAHPARTKIVVDLSMMTKLSEREARLITQNVVPKCKEHGWPLVVLCSAENEKIFERLGVADLFQFYNVHTKKSPFPDLTPPTPETDPIRAEISLFFGYFVSSIFGVSSSMFESKFSYCPPLVVDSSIMMEISQVEEPIVVRAESEKLAYRIFFLMKNADKEKLARIVFNGRTVSPAAIRDLLAEAANNILGDLTSQLAGLPAPIALKFSVPVVMDAEEKLNPSDLDLMKGLARMQFLTNEVELKTIIGYSLKC